MAAADREPTSVVCRFPQRHDPKDGPAQPAPLAGPSLSVTFHLGHRGREPHMKLATLALASVLAMSSSMALAQGAGAVGAGGTTGETTAGGAIASSLGSSTSTGTTGMSNGS